MTAGMQGILISPADDGQWMLLNYQPLAEKR
jgi:hypothetical protein